MEFDRKVEDARDAVMPQQRNQKGEGLEVTEPVKFLSSVSFAELPETPVLSAQPAAVSISLLNTERVKFTNSGAVTITEFTKGQEGQFVTFLGDGFTTIQNNALVKTNTAANKLLASAQIYGFVFVGGVWVELAGAASISAGAGLLLTGSTLSNLYVGKHVTIASTTKAFTQVTSAGYDLFGGASFPTFVTVADLTGMTQYRLSGYAGSLSTAASLRLAYSTNGSSWTRVDAVTLGSFSSDSHLVTAFGTLPAGARIATCYLSFYILQTTAGNVGNVDNFSAEFKP
jgi:hypothetical protein